MRVGYLTVVFGERVSEYSARHYINDIAGEIINLGAVEAVKCDIGVLEGKQEIEFWDESKQQ